MEILLLFMEIHNGLSARGYTMRPGATQWYPVSGATHCTANRGYTMVLSQQGLWYSVSGGYTMVLSQQGLHNGTGTQSAGATQWYSASRGYTMVPVLSQRGLHNGATQWYSASRGYTLYTCT
jgi:hypothetical protein